MKRNLFTPFWEKLIFLLHLVCICFLPSLQSASEEHHLLAMCYGPGLYGNRTASGQRLQKDTIGVAHKKWKMGSSLKIKAPNGKLTEAKIIDRGPYCKGIHLDLTEATVRKLGYRNCAHFGTQKVIVEK